MVIGHSMERGALDCPQGLKPIGDLISLMPGINPRPTARMIFSATIDSFPQQLILFRNN